MELEQAQKIANQVIQTLKPYCERIEVADSIRRKRPFCHDIDIVAIPSNQGQFIGALRALGPFKVGGSSIIRCAMPTGVELDIYIATPETWATLLLIRTGSAKHNIMLCKFARQKNMKLHADGSGLFLLVAEGCERMNEERIAGDTEESIFEALGMKYKRPEERE